MFTVNILNFAILCCKVLSKLMVDYNSMGHSLELFGARFLNFCPTWQSRKFEVREMLISPESTGFYLHAA